MNRFWQFVLIGLLLMPQVHHLVPHHHHVDETVWGHGLATHAGHDHSELGDHHHDSGDEHVFDCHIPGKAGHPDVLHQELRRDKSWGFDVGFAVLANVSNEIFFLSESGFGRIEAIEFPVSHGPPKSCPSRAPPVV